MIKTAPHVAAGVMLICCCTESAFGATVCFTDKDGKKTCIDLKPLPPDPVCLTKDTTTVDPKLCVKPIAKGIAPAPGDDPYFDAVDTFELHAATTSEPLWAFAVATAGEFSFSNHSFGDDPNAPLDPLKWTSAIVTRSEWNAGFDMPNMAPWEAPNTAELDFDSYFGIEASQVALFWANQSESSPINAEESNHGFYVARAIGVDLGAAPRFVTFGDGTVAGFGTSHVVPEPSAAVLLAMIIPAMGKLVRGGRRQEMIRGQNDFRHK